jgi:hypothetical protein
MVVPLELNTANQNLDCKEQQRAGAPAGHVSNAHDAFAPAVRK